MARDLNRVMLIGRLGADPEMRYTPSGSAVTNMRLAVNRTYRDSGGEAHEETEWLTVVAWQRLGEICGQHLSKSSRVYVEGRLQIRSWEGQDGQRRHTVEIVAHDVIMLDSVRSEAQPSRDHRDVPQPHGADIPF